VYAAVTILYLAMSILLMTGFGVIANRFFRYPTK
jgi:hypothetical protein